MSLVKGGFVLFPNLPVSFFYLFETRKRLIPSFLLLFVFALLTEVGVAQLV